MADNTGLFPIVKTPKMGITSASTETGLIVSDPSLTGLSTRNRNQNPEIYAINSISPGDIIFIGENNLDIHAALAGAGAIAWWDTDNESNMNIQPDAVVFITDPHAFFVDPSVFTQKPGDWYQWISDTKGKKVIRIEDPSINLRIWDSTSCQEVSDGVIPPGHFGNFIIESNLFPILNRTGALPSDSQIALRVTGPQGQELESLIGTNYAEKPLNHLQVDYPLWYWKGLGNDSTQPAVNDGWNTSVINPFTNTRIYEQGLYTVQATCNANGMKNNYLDPDGFEYETKTVSILQTVMLISDNVTITPDGEQPFHPGESISLSGLNDVSGSTYLFICGPGLPQAGGSLTLPLQPVLSDEPVTFTTTPVCDNDTWSMQWVIPQDITEDGNYTLYAAAAPKNLTDLYMTAFGSANISIITNEDDDFFNLVSGWNFIESPFVLRYGFDTMNIFTDVNSSGHSILTYNGTLDSWITMKANDTVIPLTGYWIYADKTYQIPLTYDKGRTIPARNLTAGWNTLGISEPKRPISQALLSIESIWSYLVEYDTELQKYRDPVINENLTDIITLTPKEAFWIYMTNNGTFSG